MSALRELLVKWGFEFDERKIDNADKRVNKLAASAKALAAIFAGSALVGRVKAFTNEMVATGTAINDASTRLGVSIDALQRLDFAATMVNSSFADVTTGLRRLQRRATAAAQGNKSLAAAFNQLGVSVRDSRGGIKDTYELFKDVGFAISNIEDPAQRSALAFKIFGNEGLRLVPMFNNGAAGLESLLGKLDELGGGMGQDAIDQVAKTSDLLGEYNFALRSLKSTIVTMIMPAINALLGYIIKTFAAIARLEKGTNMAKAALVVFGAAAVKAAFAARAAWLPTLAAFVKAALPIAALVLVVDELITAFEGGETVIGNFIDSLFGVGTTAKVVDSVKDSWKHFFTDVFENDTRDAADKWELFFIRLGAPIEQFGKDLDEAWGFIRRDFSNFMDQWNRDVDEALAFLWRDIKAWFSELGEDFKQLGKDILKGLVEGLKFGAKEVKDFFVNLGKESIGAIKGIFKSNSPSKVMIQLGRDIDAGLIQGIADGERDVHTQARKTFASEAFAPRIRLPDSVRATGPSRPLSFDQRNNITINVQGSGNVRHDVREGVRLGLADDRDALLAALEAAV